MKFFFSDLRSCYRPAGPPPQTPEEPAVTGGGKPCSSRRKKHSQWQPGLTVISEDGVVVSEKESEKTVELGKKPPSKSRSSTVTTAKDRRSGSRNNYADAYDDYYRKKFVPLFIPAFSPTPYPF